MRTGHAPRCLALLLSVLLVLQLGIPSAAAQEQTDVATTAEDTYNITTTTDDLQPEQPQEPDQSAALGYVLVNQANLSLGDTQEIVVGLDDESADLLGAVLTVRADATGETTDYTATQLADGAARFTIPCDDAGSFTLDAVCWETSETSSAVRFAEVDIAAAYGVDTLVTTLPDAYAVEDTDEGDLADSVVIDVTAMGSDDALTDAIESALTASEDELTGDTATAQKVSADGTADTLSTSKRNVVVVIDAGHDATHSGASTPYSSLNESDYTLKIAQYCKAELEAYQGVTVYMTRTTKACPYGGSDVTSTKCNQGRVEYAASVNADYYVSIHLNSETSNSVSGAEVYYPNQNYNSDLSAEGKSLAQTILKQLVSLGLTSRGVKIRNSEDGTKYDDGSLADYYGIIRRCKEAEICGIIVEHAFLTSKSDFQTYLSTDEKLQKLGVADATGIASYLGLSKQSASVSTVKLTAQQDGATASLNLTLTGVTEEATAARFYVWSANNGQDDLVTYNGKRNSDGSWTATAPLTAHGDYGAYIVHCYIKTASGWSYAAGISTNVSKVTATAQILTTDEASGSFRVNITNVNLPDAVQLMRVAVWSDNNGQDDLIWTTATRDGNDWYIDVDTDAHKKDTGTYNIHVYVKDTMGNSYAIRCITTEVTQVNVKPTLTAVWSAEKGTLEITLTGYLTTSSVSALRFAVWSEENGQDDLHWYTATRNASGSWTATVPLSQHGRYGNYFIHCYATVSGSNKFVSGAAVTVSKVTAQAKAVTTSATGSFRVNITNVNVPEAVKELRVAVWSSVNGQDDLIWTTATRDGDDWYIDVDTYDHNYDTGTYNIHVYTRDMLGNWYAVRCITQSVTIQENQKKLSADWNAAEAQLEIDLSGYLMGADVTGIRFAVWSAENGQDDLVWYTAQRQSNGDWTASVPLTKHGSYGSYYIHCYRQTSSGSQYVAATTATVSKVTAKVAAVTTDSITGSFRVNITDLNAPDAVQQMRVAVWSSEDGQDDLIWTTATRSGNSWYIDVDTADHRYDSGTYNIHVYVRDTMGGWYAARCIGYTVTVHQDEATLTVAMDTNTDYMTITLAHAYLDASASQVRFGVWSTNNGQDDLQWYTATYANGVWSYQVPLANHGYDTGTYQIHCYYQIGSVNKLLRSATITPYTGSRPSTTELSSANAKAIWSYLRAKGLSAAGAAGLMGNLYAESGLVPNNLQGSYETSLGYTDATYTAAVDNGTYRYGVYTDARSSFTNDKAGYGLAQWTYSTRKQGLYDYAQSKGTSIGDLTTQLDYLWQELTNDYPTLLAVLKTTNSVKTASDLVLTQFERPADQSASVKEKRANYGRAYYSYFNN